METFGRSLIIRNKNTKGNQKAKQYNQKQTGSFRDKC